MLEGINVDEIKKYNESLRAHKDRATKLKAEIEFNTTELNRLCIELTAELGIQVTPDNLNTIYIDRVTKINDTLTTGTEILKRIAEEEAATTALGTANIPNIGGGSTVVPTFGNGVPQVPTFNNGAPSVLPLGPIGTIGTPEQQQAIFGQGGQPNMFSSLDGGKETFKETSIQTPFPGNSIQI